MEIRSSHALLLACALACASCTPSKAPEQPVEAPVDEKPAAPAPAAEAPPAKDTRPVVPAQVVDNVVELSAGDTIAFSANEIRVQAGKKVTVNLTHTGKMPAEAMGHNFVLLAQGVDRNAFGLKAVGATDTGYIPAGDEVIAHTKVVGGGESDSVTFDAPPPGTYQFICSFPGHYGVMYGAFIVE